MTDNWRSLAACADADPDLFFPPLGQGKGSGWVFDWTPARRVCALCPVRNVCRDLAPKGRETGMWGGMTPDERLYYRRTGLKKPVTRRACAWCGKYFLREKAQDRKPPVPTKYCSEECRHHEQARLTRVAQRRKKVS